MMRVSLGVSWTGSMMMMMRTKRADVRDADEGEECRWTWACRSAAMWTSR